MAAIATYDSGGRIPRQDSALFFTSRGRKQAGWYVSPCPRLLNSSNDSFWHEGTLTPAVRNYVLSHSSDVFDSSYQPKHVKENLISALAPEVQADSDAALFQLLRQSSLRCDELAPINPSERDIVRWKNTRKDLNDLLETEGYSKHAKIRTIVKRLSNAYIEEQKQQYFEETNKRRAFGQAINDLIPPIEPYNKTKARSNSGLSVAGTVSSLFQLHSEQSPISGQETIYVEMLVAYLNETQHLNPTCFLCQSTFAFWKQVWKHSNDNHRNDAIWPFSCPECIRGPDSKPGRMVRTRTRASRAEERGAIPLSSGLQNVQKSMDID